MNAPHTASFSPESVLDEHGLASVTLSASWFDGIATHEDQLHVEKLSVWRELDLLPPDIASNGVGMQAGDQAQQSIAAGETVGPWDKTRRVITHEKCFDRHYRRGPEVEPRLGRFYPQGFLHDVDSISREAIAPLRIVDLDNGRLTADLNHPLARFDLGIKLRLDQVLPGHDRRGGRCASPLDDLLQYPGLAAPLGDGRDTEFGDDAHGMARVDERPDTAFYAMSRLVQHLDTHALSIVNRLYRRLLPEQAEVLDLMASFDSHLQGIPLRKLHALGMNAEELNANRAASQRVIQDLNESPALPFPDASLDAIVCTASIEYLTRPHQVLNEALRVLRPGGVLAASFSNRWFPTKAIRIWSNLHEFERVGMVAQWLRQAGFSDLHTFSSRGWPRAADDRHANETPLCDPVYGVWGFKGPA
jgi:SAM-dependent methyltransferase